MIFPNNREIVALTKENEIEDFTEQNANEFFAQLNKNNELSDEELDNVFGGIMWCKHSI
ncbi:MAG: hypothetical protein PUG48_00440 [Clostridia bacterium]|nr:hypothetical protein [Clostridia bacterium]